ncbi:MAG: hypothetical protein Q7T74_02860 [Candidatus Saccharibacteria bacterium]|nr:hypothetical protein [Candidatus Saccharibacteria bacterium]
MSMETPSWPNLRELVQYTTSSGSEEDTRIDNWFHNLAQSDQNLLITILESYINGDKALKDVPSASDVLRYTDPENGTQTMAGNGKVEKWFNQLSEEELEQVLGHLDSYHDSRSPKTKASLYYSLSEYIFSEQGIVLSTEKRLHKLANRTAEHFDRLGRIENDITHDKKVIVRGSRDESLAGKTAVLQGRAARIETSKNDYSHSPILVIDNTRFIPAFPLMKGAYTAQSGANRKDNDGSYLAEEDAILASLEVKCEHIANTQHPRLEAGIEKRHVMRIFNTCIDVLYETTSSFVLKSDHIVNLIKIHNDIIERELKEQLREILARQATNQIIRSEKEPDVLSKYVFALDVVEFFKEDRLSQAA